MLWDRYFLVSSNPLDFVLEKWKEEIIPLFWASNAPFPLLKIITEISNAPFTMEKGGVISLFLHEKGVTPLKLPCLHVKSAVLEF